MKLKETRKGRKKGFIALCLAVAMAFSYNVPAFAKEYVVNPDCNKDNRQDNPNVGEYEKGAVIWAGDDSFVLNYFNPDDNSYEFVNDLTYSFIIDDKQVNWTPVNGATEKTTNEVPLIYSQGDNYDIMLSNDNNYNDCYSEDGTIRAWELDSIVSGASSSGNCKRSFTITLKALTTSKVIFHFVGETDADLYYVEGKEKNISIKSVVEELGLENELPELLDYDGWYNNPDFDGDTIASIPSNASGKVEFYAKPSTHKITYETNGGKFATGYEAPDSFTIKSDDITLPTADDITKEGYEFVGWYETENFSGEKVTTIPSGTKSDKTFYAKYEAIRYNIKYVTNGGAFKDGANASYTAEDNLVLQQITKEGQKFIGWFDNADFKGDAVTEIAKGSTGDKTFYAKFEEQEYDVEAAKTYQQEKDGEYLVHVISDDITPDDVLSINVAGEEVDKSDASKVKLEIGSVKVTFTPDFMNGLKVGETKIEIQFKEGKAGTTVNILAPEEEKKDSNSGSVDSGTTDNKTTDDKKDTAVTDDKAKDASVEGGQTGTDDAATTTKTDNSDSAPKTGDSFMLGFVIMLLTLSMAGIAVTQIARKKKESESDE